MIKAVKVQHVTGLEGQLDTYGPEDYPLEVRMDSGSGRLIVMAGMSQILYAKGAWSRVSIEYTEQGERWTKKEAKERIAVAMAALAELEEEARAMAEFEAVGERAAGVDAVTELEEEAKGKDADTVTYPKDLSVYHCHKCQRPGDIEGSYGGLYWINHRGFCSECQAGAKDTDK